MSHSISVRHAEMIRVLSTPLRCILRTVTLSASARVMLLFLQRADLDLTFLGFQLDPSCSELVIRVRACLGLTEKGVY